VGKPEAKRPLGRPVRVWEDKIKTNVQEMGTWIGLFWLRIGAGDGPL